MLGILHCGVTKWQKELRIYFNLDNENEKSLYEHLMKRTSASGYLKDLALDALEGRISKPTEIDSSAIVEQLKNINNTLSNLSLSIPQNSTTQSKSNDDNSVINEVDMGSINLDGIDFSDINGLNKGSVILMILRYNYHIRLPI